MEQTIYSRSITKEALSFRVMDRKLVDRKYTMAELAELYKLKKLNFDPERELNLENIEDQLFYELLDENRDRISRYHTHESMLEFTEELELTETEQAEAWRSLIQNKKTNESMAWYDQRRNHTRRSSNDTEDQSWIEIAAGEKYQPTVKDEVSEEKDSKTVVKAEAVSEDINSGNNYVAGSSSALDSDVVDLTKMFGGIPLKQEDSIMSVGEGLTVDLTNLGGTVAGADAEI